MKPTIAALVIIAAALALSGEPPKPVAASPVIIDNSAEVARLKAELETLRVELAQAKSEGVKARSPEPVALVVTHPTASGGGVCANGSCAAGSRRVFTGERRPLRRVVRVPRLFGRR